MHPPAIKLLSSCFSAHFQQGERLIGNLLSSGECCSWLEVKRTAMPWACNMVSWRNSSTPELSSLPGLGKVRVKARTIPADELCQGGTSGGPCTTAIPALL